MFKLIQKNGSARLGIFETKNGLVETPSFVAVATDGYIRTLEPEDIPKTNTSITISNTFHLWQSLGEEGLNEFPGLHDFMGFKGLTMTDSGGFQVFSLGSAREFNTGKVLEKSHRQTQGPSQVRVTNSGVYFTRPSSLDKNLEESPKDGGEEVYLDAELSIRIQEQLGADIVLAFDEPSAPHHDHAYTKVAMERTHAWAERCLEAKTTDQKLYGITQGGHFEELRSESGKFIGRLPFDGFAIGGSFGSSFGSEKASTLKEISWTTPFLPEQKPRHLLGIGRVEDIFEAIERGVDTLDCVIPTREARHGSIWTETGRFDITKSKFSNDDSPLVEGCLCPTCGEESITKSQLYNLFREKSFKAGRLATMHNLWFFNDLMAQIRGAIKNLDFKRFKESYLKKIVPTSPLTK